MERTAAGTLVAALLAMMATFASPASAETVRAVEYFHPAFEHYFVTSNSAEIAALDNGAVEGWFRTGQRYRVDDAQAAGLEPVCRFHTAAFAGKSTHFFTASAAECDLLKSSALWSYEGVAFYAAVPDAQGNCTAGFAAINRLYNAGRGGAPNHAYTADAAKKNTLAGAGWVAEGVAFCAPLAAPDPVTQTMALYNSLWNLPPKAGYTTWDDSGRVLVAFLPFTTVNFEAASRTFQNFQIAVPPAPIAHLDLSGDDFVLEGDGWYVYGDFLGDGGGAGWDPLAGEFVLVMGAYDSPNLFKGVMWTFENAQGPDASVCTMGIAKNYGANPVNASALHPFQPFILTGCEMGVAMRRR
jgi:hypothetical protein